MTRYIWLEEYKGCGCCEEAERKKDLFGYCPKHGSDVARRWKVNRRAWLTAKKEIDGEDQREDA